VANVSMLLGNRIMVKVTQPESMTKGGIVVPDGAKEKKNTGVVVTVGKGVTEDIEVGDMVMFMPFGVVEMMTSEGVCSVVDVEDVVTVSGTR
jgi:chaperonin GroES